MDPSEFRRNGHALVEWIADYLAGSERYPVLPRVAPGDVVASLPSSAPEHGEPFDRIFADFERVLVPALTHWNHPGFFGYFAITASAPGVLGEFLAAALNQQAMLWRTSPASTELEEVALGWLRELMGLPDTFEGVIYDTASVSSLHGLAAAREAAIPNVRNDGLAGRADLAGACVYASEHAHSSIDKAVILLGHGHRALRRIPSDAHFRMRVDVLEDAITRDRAAGLVPVAVVATAGTTSTTSVDPIRDIADVCRRERVWLHVDAAICWRRRDHARVPRALRRLGAGRFDRLSIPTSGSSRRWTSARSIAAAWMWCDKPSLWYPNTSAQRKAHEGVRNLMDTGIQLGRRFRSLKLWMVLRHFGGEGIRAALAEHIRLARLFAHWVDEDPDFERLAPVPFSVVCFRARPRARAQTSPAELDVLNEQLLKAVNDSGDVFLSHTRLNNVIALRLAIGNLQTEERHVARAWQLLREHTAQLVR
jgi:aromatic-L-amino-acid decarboxylase